MICKAFLLRILLSFPYALDKYSPVRVSILIISSCSTNNGTATCAPVSTIAGLVAPCAVLPLNPGSVSVTRSSTAVSYTHLKGP